ncbi:Aldose 1-epimerase [Flavobacterium fluvii]|uniref:Aldose 1-epimerase n=1 Tax=Flavobacterium fluvii TaxID=468056 RepID=A0A1M5FTW6_9FLAO|nr:Aldose 1-epimerase [Flavobacterium fluvii]
MVNRLLICLQNSLFGYSFIGTYILRTGLCLETQHYSDSPNQKDFPSTVLSPGENYKTKTTFKFSVK